MDLMGFASSLDTEQQRYVCEGFSSDEELSVYDLLFSENLTKQEIEAIKKVSVSIILHPYSGMRILHFLILGYAI